MEKTPGDPIPGFYVDDENVASQASDVRPVASQLSDASSGLQVSQKTDAKPGFTVSHGSHDPRIIQHDVSTRKSQYGDASPDSRISHGNYSPGPASPNSRISHGNYSPGPAHPNSRISHGNYSPGPASPNSRISHGNYSPGPASPNSRISHGNYSPGPASPNSRISHGNYSPRPASPNSRISHGNYSPGPASPNSRISHGNYSPGPSMSHHDASPRPTMSQHGHISPGPRMSSGDDSPVGPRMSRGDYSPVGPRMSRGDYSPGPRMSCSDYNPVGPRMSGDYSPVGPRMSGGDYSPVDPRMSGDYSPVGPRMSGGDYIPVGPRMSGGDYSPVGPRMSGGDYSPVGPRMSGDYSPVGPRMSGGDYNTVGPRMSGGDYSPVGPRMSGGDYNPVGPRMSGGDYSPVGPRMSGGDYSPVGPRMSGGDYSPGTRRSQQTRYFYKTPSSPNPSDIPSIQTSQCSDASSDIMKSQHGGLEEKPGENLANSPAPKDKLVRNLSGEFCELQNVGQRGGAEDIKDRTDNNDSGMNNSAPKMYPSIQQQQTNMKVVDCRPPSQHPSCVPQYPASSYPVLHNVSPSEHLSSSPHYPSSSFPVVMNVPSFPYHSPQTTLSHNASPYQDIPLPSYSSPSSHYPTQNPYDAVSLSDSESLLQEDNTSFMSLSSLAHGAKEDNSNPGCTEHPQPSADMVTCPHHQFPNPDHTDIESFPALPPSTRFTLATGEKIILSPRKPIAPNDLESLKLNYETIMCNNRVWFTGVPRPMPLNFMRIHAEKMGTVTRVERKDDGMLVMYLRPEDATKAFSHQHELLGVRLQVHRPKRRSCKLFVTNVPHYLTDLDIVKAFYKYGVVLDLTCPKRYEINKSYCFVSIDEEGAEKILEHQQIQIQNVMCGVHMAKNSEIQLSSPNRQTNMYYNNRPLKGHPVTAFLSNLPSWATVEHLKIIFNAFDSDCYVKINKNFKGMGYVTFTYKEARQRALHEYHSIQGHSIHLNYDVPSECRVHLGKLAPDMTWWVLERELKHIGNVIKIHWPNQSPSGHQPDFCFVLFQDADVAAGVINAGKVYICGRAVPARLATWKEKTT